MEYKNNKLPWYLRKGWSFFLLLFVLRLPI